MSLNSDYQKLEPGNAIRLIEVDGSAFGVGDVLRFHSHNIPHSEAEINAAGGDETLLPAKSIWWQGNEYKAWPYELDGIEASTSGSSASPKLSVANLDASITALCLAYDDMLQAKVTIHDTLAQYLDAQNFAEGNPTADPLQDKMQVWYIDAKSSETNEVVEFTLSSPMDLQGLMIPTRQLHSLCTWCIRGQYRSGNGCDYAGTRYFDKHGNSVSDPSLDECSGLLDSGCKPRFGENNELPFGGFTGTSLIRS